MSLLERLTALPGLGSLPVLEVLPDLGRALAQGPELAVLEAPPGSGKTLLAPPWLVDGGLCRRAYVLVPRRVNARLPVLFLETALGAEVGYRIRFESRWAEAQVKVGFLTYGTALRSFVDSPPGPEDLVVFDEFHERPWEGDLLLAHLRALGARGPKLLLMSATVDHSSLPAGTPVVRSGGRLHPVEVRYEKAEPMLLARPEGLASLVAQRSYELGASGGEQLIFLPGLAAIRAVEAVLRADSLSGPVDILHSTLPEAEIRRVVERPASAGFRRILSTDIAESSVTLPGVTTVIDAGLQRRPRRDAFGLGITLETVRAPVASLVQRSGRAGRLRAGLCHRVLTSADERHRDGFGRPEIVEVDGKTLALHLAAMGHLGRWAELTWLTSPKEGALAQAVAWLERYGLVEGNGLSSRGRRVLSSACAPRVGLFALLAAEAGWPLGQIVDWSYALEAGGGRDSGGVARELGDLLNDRSWNASRDGRLLQRLRDTFASVPRGVGVGDPLLQAFGDTLVELRGDRALPRAGGAEALALRTSHPATTRYGILLGTAPTGRDGPLSQVTLYHPVDADGVWEEYLDEMVESRHFLWDDKGRVREVRRTLLGELVAEEETVAAAPGPEVAVLLRSRLTPAELGEELAAFARRLSLFFSARPELALEVAERLGSTVEDPVEGLVLDYLGTINRWSKTSAAELFEHVKTSLGYATLRALEAALPTSVHLPGRQRPVAVVYPEQGAPFVASKLQDFFGWKPPLLLDGRLKLACHLLAPSGRPVQITEDLLGFWGGSYQQVRKDLRGRYPKHAWPENP